MRTVTVAAHREVTAPMARVRGAVLSSLARAGFELTVNQLTRIEGRVGSLLAVATRDTEKLPVHATVDMDRRDDGTSVLDVHLADGFPTAIEVGSPEARHCLELFDVVVHALDDGLRELDPDAGPFAPPEIREGTVGGAPVPPRPPDPPGASPAGPRGAARAWTPGCTVRVDGPTGTAWLTPEEVQVHLAIALLVLGHPGSLPENLSADVERVAARLEQALAATGWQSAHVQLTTTDRPAFEFLHQQVRIRSRLPLRTLHHCRTCQYERITNPAYEQLLRRNAMFRGLTGLIGASITRAGVSPFIALGALFRMKRLDPDYVCPRCQGMDADEQLVTYCPACGQLCRAPVLRRCTSCQHDFRRDITTETLWGDSPAPLPPRPTVPPRPTAPPPRPVSPPPAPR